MRFRLPVVPATWQELFRKARMPVVILGYLGYWAVMWLVKVGAYGATAPIDLEVLTMITVESVIWAAVCVAGIAGGWLLSPGHAPNARQFFVAITWSFVLILFATGSMTAISRVMRWDAPSLGSLLLNFLPRYLLITGTCIGLGHGLRAIFLEREETTRLASAEASILKARLRAYSTQLQPNILFPALTSVRHLIREDVAAADLRLIKLSELLRLSLYRARREWVSLEEEARFVSLSVTFAQEDGPCWIRSQIRADALSTAVPVGLVGLMVESVRAPAVDSAGESYVLRGVRSSACLFLSVRAVHPIAELAQDGAGTDRRSQLAALLSAQAPSGWIAAERCRSGTRRVRVVLPVQSPAEGTHG